MSIVSVDRSYVWLTMESRMHIYLVMYMYIRC